MRFEKVTDAGVSERGGVISVDRTAGGHRRRGCDVEADEETLPGLGAGHG
jgi:hypothetical protein